MTKYRNDLPQMKGPMFITDSGFETTVIFHDGMDLPYFAAFDLLRTQSGRQRIKDYYRTHAKIAEENGVGFILEGITWRASSDWGDKMGYSAEALATVNHESVEVMEEIRQEYDSVQTPCVISGCIGPRGDGYVISDQMTADQAEAYHEPQVAALAEGGVDMIGVLTMTYPAEAIGITWAAKKHGIPVNIGFTVETDGHLPNGQSLQSAIEDTDAATDNYTSYFMINCAHPSHFDHVLESDAPWLSRIRSVRANASTMSHAELDCMEELDDGDPHDLAQRYRSLKTVLPNLTVIGGCCGTDHRHVEAMCHACNTEAA